MSFVNVKPMVVGYKGEIGSFILNGLLRTMPKALDIMCVDINETEDEVVERIEKSSLIFLCVPMFQTGVWIKKYRHLIENKTVVEQCSLKEWLFQGNTNLDIISMHILFKPSQTPNLEDRTVAIIQPFPLYLVPLIECITQANIIVYSNVKEHDMEMATQQALVHRTLLVLGDIIAKNGKGETYIGKKVLELKKRIMKGDKELYKAIQDNRHLSEPLKKMEKGLAQFDIDNYFIKEQNGNV